MAEAKPKPIIDVAKPGKSAPSTTSKSIIVGHGPVVADPMVTADTPNDETSDTVVAPAPTTTRIRLQPLADSPKPKLEPEPELSQPKAKVEPESEPEPKPSPEPTKPDDEPQPSEPATESEPELAPAQPGVPDKPHDPAETAEAEAAAQAEHDATIQKLIDSKQYFLPIETVESRRSKRFVALGVLLSLVLLLAWADIALDAGLLQIGNVKPVTHFFSH